LRQSQREIRNYKQKKDTAQDKESTWM